LKRGTPTARPASTPKVVPALRPMKVRLLVRRASHGPISSLMFFMFVPPPKLPRWLP
jgi:hypothetical protein